MKTLLALVLLSPTAQALEIGDLVSVNRADITCQDGRRPPVDCHPHFYIDCSDFYLESTAAINASVAGFSNLSASFRGACELIPPNETLSFEVLEKRVTKDPGGAFVEGVKLGINGIIFDGHKVRH
jgi:hypothetical protein